MAAVRTWPIEEKVADVHIKFNDAFYAKADGLVETAGTPSSEELLENLRWARRFQEAHALTIQLTAVPDAPVRHWQLRAEAALRAGQLDDAREAVKRGQAIDALFDPPPLLRKRPSPTR